MLNGLQYTVVRKGKGIASFAGAKVCTETLLLLRTNFGLWQMKVNYVGRLTKNKKVKTFCIRGHCVHILRGLSQEFDRSNKPFSFKLGMISCGSCECIFYSDL